MLAFQPQSEKFTGNRKLCVILFHFFLQLHKFVPSFCSFHTKKALWHPSLREICSVMTIAQFYQQIWKVIHSDLFGVHFFRLERRCQSAKLLSYISKRPKLNTAPAWSNSYQLLQRKNESQYLWKNLVIAFVFISELDVKCLAVYVAVRIAKMNPKVD